jgi:hypothetical protein
MRGTNFLFSLHTFEIFVIVLRAQKKKTKCAAGSPAASTQLALCLRLASMYKAESWQRAVTLDDSTPQ